jgi:predicted NAD/FAD-binding protein
LSRPPRRASVTLFEAGSHFGGHANTVDVTLEGVTHGVDTGFLVCNERTYPGLLRLFDELGVATAPSEMSFSVQARQSGIEWSGSNLAGVFAQRANLLRPTFWRMLADIARFNHLTTALARHNEDDALAQTVGDFLDQHHFRSEFREWYLLPMIACIWSCPTEQMLAFPVGTLLRFCHNHGLLQVSNRPQWMTVRGGSRQYVRRIVSGLEDARLNVPVLGVQRRESGALVRTTRGVEHFDRLVLACHSDQALRLLGADATPEETRALGAIEYHPNRAVLHTDASLLPARRSAWAAWNYESSRAGGAQGVCLHYLLNKLQPLPWRQPVIVSLNPIREPRADCVLERFAYDHPVFDAGAVAAQARVAQLQGQRRTWFCGAWLGYGFHEDGLKAGLAVADCVRLSLLQGEERGAA